MNGFNLKNTCSKISIIFLTRFLIIFLNIFIGFCYTENTTYEITKNKLGLKKSIIFVEEDTENIRIKRKITYFDDGSRHSYYSFRNNLKHGKYANWSKKTYKLENGSSKQIHFLSQAGYYKKGRLHGSSKSYFPNGNVFWKGSYINGRVEGLVIEYHSNGKIHRTVNYVNGNKHGKYFSYFPSGENEIKGEYYHGMRVGEWIFSNSQQNVVENITYSDGKKWQGTYTIWDGTKRKIDCSGDLVIPVLSYENGVLSHLYRDNNLDLKNCD